MGNSFWDELGKASTGNETYDRAFKGVAEFGDAFFKWRDKKRTEVNRNKRWELWKAAYNKDPEKLERQSVSGTAAHIKIGNPSIGPLTWLNDKFLNPDSTESTADIRDYASRLESYRLQIHKQYRALKTALQDLTKEGNA